MKRSKLLTLSGGSLDVIETRFCAINEGKGPCLREVIGIDFESLYCSKHKYVEETWTYADCIRRLFELLTECDKKILKFEMENTNKSPK